MKIGDNDYKLPFRIESRQSSHPECPDMFAYWIVDADGEQVFDWLVTDNEDNAELLLQTFNDLAQLHAEVAALRQTVAKLAEIELCRQAIADIRSTYRVDFFQDKRTGEIRELEERISEALAAPQVRAALDAAKRGKDNGKA